VARSVFLLVIFFSHIAAAAASVIGKGV